jgi:DnaA regulatory inactivator Hda
MNGDRQLVLDLGHRPAFGRDDFLVAPGNHEAVDWIDRWPAWPGHALAIFGPAGCGKSHLVHVFALRAQARVLTAADITVANVPTLVENHAALALENGEAVADPRGLLHLYNAVKERAGHLLLASREPPARWPVTLPDLKSRVASVPAVRIAAPDDAMMEAVLVKLFADRQVTVAPDVIAYLLRHMDRTFAAARQIVAKADAAALAGKRAVTIPLIKDVLGGAEA